MVIVCYTVHWRKVKFRKFYKENKHIWNIKNLIKYKRSKIKAKKNMKELIKSQEDLNLEYQKIINKNFWDLV